MCLHAFCTALTPNGLAEFEWLQQFMWSTIFSPSWQHKARLKTSLCITTKHTSSLPSYQKVPVHWHVGSWRMGITSSQHCSTADPGLIAQWIPVTERGPLHTAPASCIAKASWHIPGTAVLRSLHFPPPWGITVPQRGINSVCQC